MKNIKTVLLIGSETFINKIRTFLNSKYPETNIITATNRDNIKDVDLVIDESEEPTPSPFDSEPFIIRARHKLEEPYYPKKKHMPKGHQRPYKFHL